MLVDAKLLYDAKSYKSCANRSYYAILHAMRSVLALDGIDYKKHSAVIADFRRLYIKSGLIDSVLSGTITALFQVRNDCDYNDFYVVSKTNVLNQLEAAEFFLIEIERFLFERK